MLSVKILAALTFGFSVITFAPAAKAVSLVPSTEGEIKTTNFDCIDITKCIDTTNTAQSPFTFEVTSLGYDDNLGLSRLFVDNRDTPNTYGLGITFGETDAGTNPTPGENWFRAVAMPLTGDAVEDGQLEVGKFLFDFLDKTVASVTFDLFDVEDANKTKILKVNGVELNPQIIAAAGADSNRQKITIYNVNSFEIQLGNPSPNSKFPNTGDGVAMRASVPEPSTVISLGALAVAGMFGTRQRKKVSVG